MTTKFILLIQDVFLDVDTQILGKEYEEFAQFLLSEKNNFLNKEDYHNALVYTRTELVDIAKKKTKKKLMNF